MLSSTIPLPTESKQMQKVVASINEKSKHVNACDTYECINNMENNICGMTSIHEKYKLNIHMNQKSQTWSYKVYIYITWHH